MKKIPNIRKLGITLIALLTCILLFTCSLVNAQVGIGTNDPESTLHIAGRLRVDTLPNYTRYFITANSVGEFGKAEYGQNIPETITIQATAPVVHDAIGSGYYLNNNIDLGLSYLLTIPTGRYALVEVHYSIPMGSLDTTNELQSYMGATLLKNGIPIEAARRKFSLPDVALSPTKIYRMGYVSATYYERIDNSTGSDLDISYAVVGRVEQHYSTQSDVNYIFNMWSATGDNFGWGKAVLTINVELK